jgi:glycosyltransferase involved in cell wall biosynthesis
MPTVAYLANLFPAPVEPYVTEEIRELRRRGMTVIPCSARKAVNIDSDLAALANETRYLQPAQLKLLARAALLCVLKFRTLNVFYRRLLLQGRESVSRRACALIHTWLGVYYALLIEPLGIEHIHVHHGYFASWIAMVAARFLGIEFSMTLHGSDLLLHPAFLDLKLKYCKSCVTVSEFNRRHLLKHYPGISPDKIIVRRMGVGVPRRDFPLQSASKARPTLLAVGRLHPVKNHEFLIRACRQLKTHDVSFLCQIAGDGPQRMFLEALIRDLELRDEVHLVGHLSHQELEACYASADLVVLTSRSEGIPLVLMEAMAHGKPVLAPAITGIPELVLHENNGFLYRPDSMNDFVARVTTILQSASSLGPLCDAARQHVRKYFDREANLAAFCNLLIAQISPTQIRPTHGALP